MVRVRGGADHVVGSLPFIATQSGVAALEPEGQMKRALLDDARARWIRQPVQKRRRA